MSIFTQVGQVGSLPLNDIERNKMVRRSILSLFSDVRLKGKISIPVFDSKIVSIFLFIHKEAINVRFDINFPKTCPQLWLQNPLSEYLVQSETLNLWTQKSKLSDVIYEIYQNMEHYLESQSSITKNQSTFECFQDARQNEKIKEEKESFGELIQRKIMMNGCADNQLTETKNLNRHFRSKLKEVYLEIDKDNMPLQGKQIEESFKMLRVGFEDIAQVLRNQWFNGEVRKQMQNGRFIHKIMKGTLSIKSKKLMIKYYHVMLAAVLDPDNFVKWKYQ